VNLEHKCYNNFDHNASSTSMENDTIAEGYNDRFKMQINI